MRPPDPGAHGLAPAACATTSSAQRVGEGLGISADDVRGLKPLPSQGWGDAEQQRLDNLGNNGPRDVEGIEMTHCVPNEHVALTEESLS